MLPPELTGVDAQIVLVFGNRFPMIGAHKVLAAYSCLVPRVVSGQFDPTTPPRDLAIDRELRPRGNRHLTAHAEPRRRGAAREHEPRTLRLARCLGARSRRRDPHSGSESNVKEIYDACNELEKDPGNFILNQFSEFANHIGHYTVTGRALGHVFETLRAANPTLDSPQ